MWLAMSEIDYRVNEIFYSVQAEGRNAGRPAIFVRLAGCNLRCPFCDTNHANFRVMSRDMIESEANSLDPTGEAMVVFTGGEPTLQLKNEERFFPTRFTAIETNGTMPVPLWIDWVTISPKTMLSAKDLLDRRVNEIKCVYGSLPNDYIVEIGRAAYQARVLTFIQPMADSDGCFNIRGALTFAKEHPRWTLSLQWHKLFDIR